VESEHVERQDEREQEIRSDIDDLEAKGDQLEERREEFDEQVGELQEDWEQKSDSAESPGAIAPGDGMDLTGGTIDAVQADEDVGDAQNPDDPGDEDDGGDAEARPEEDE
jgi:predicted nuclease with TOPRIM domain